MRIAPPGIRHLLAVASGKGGVGKTTTTVNLALALHHFGLRVGIYDADIYGPNIPLLLGIHQTRQTQDAYAPILRAAGSVPYIDPLNRFGIEIMSVGLVIGEEQVINPLSDAVGALVLQNLMDVRWPPLDVLLIDLPPSSGEPQESILRKIRLDGVIIVTTPQDLSLLDAGRSLKLFAQAAVPILGLIENMSFFICPDCGQEHQIFQRSAQWEIPVIAAADLLGRIPLDPAISRSINQSHPLVHASPESPHTAHVLQAAQNTWEKLSNSQLSAPNSQLPTPSS